MSTSLTKSLSIRNLCERYLINYSDNPLGLKYLQFIWECIVFHDDQTHNPPVPHDFLPIGSDRMSVRSELIFFPRFLNHTFIYIKKMIRHLYIYINPEQVIKRRPKYQQKGFEKNKNKFKELNF